ncbi:hypothetical protein PG984_009601 [Apiospora sp. TS-2023a]|uniref:Uncharacterized protein n=1 Tax=Apiospora saccharicola TaxID=335842 RepID=A0ABR1UN09_9PEZI
MQFLAILTLAATAVLALPSNTLETRGACTPPSYACKPDHSGWLVCNVDGSWLNGGSCPKHTTCSTSPQNNLPYCT